MLRLARHELGHIAASAGTASRLEICPIGKNWTRAASVYYRDPNGDPPPAIVFARLYGARVLEELLDIPDDGRDAADQSIIAHLAKLADCSDERLALIRRMTKAAMAPDAAELDLVAHELAERGPANYRVTWINSHEFTLERIGK